VLINCAVTLHASVAHVPLPGPVLERLVAQSLKAPARVWQSALEGLLEFDDTADLGRIVAPTLLLWGERDRLFSREEQERLAAAIPGARLRVILEAGHSPHLERLERVADSLDAFKREG
jgi:non-heme chloroperoxidase